MAARGPPLGPRRGAAEALDEGLALARPSPTRPPPTRPAAPRRNHDASIWADYCLEERGRRAVGGAAAEAEAADAIDAMLQRSRRTNPRPMPLHALCRLALSCRRAIARSLPRDDPLRGAAEADPSRFGEALAAAWSSGRGLELPGISGEDASAIDGLLRDVNSIVRGTPKASAACLLGASEPLCEEVAVVDPAPPADAIRAKLAGSVQALTRASAEFFEMYDGELRLAEAAAQKAADCAKRSCDAADSALGPRAKPKNMAQMSQGVQKLAAQADSAARRRRDERNRRKGRDVGFRLELPDFAGLF